MLYYYGTADQISDWNDNGIVGTLPNGQVIPYLYYGQYIDFKWALGLWLWSCAVGLHVVSTGFSVFALCCEHQLYVPEELPYEEDWDDEEGYYEEMTDMRSEDPKATMTKQDVGADQDSDMMQF